MPAADEALLAQLRECLGDLPVSRLDIVDESAAHAGHAGAQQGAHLFLSVVSPAFSGRSPLQRHRLVYERLSALLGARIHALRLELRAPEEDRPARPAPQA